MILTFLCHCLGAGLLSSVLCFLVLRSDLWLCFSVETTCISWYSWVLFFVVPGTPYLFLLCFVCLLLPFALLASRLFPCFHAWFCIFILSFSYLGSVLGYSLFVFWGFHCFVSPSFNVLCLSVMIVFIPEVSVYLWPPCVPINGSTTHTAIYKDLEFLGKCVLSTSKKGSLVACYCQHSSAYSETEFCLRVGKVPTKNCHVHPI